MTRSETTGHCTQTHDAHPRIGSKDAPHPTTTFGCVARVFKEQGWVALWRGNLVNVLKKVLTALVSGCVIRVTFQFFRHVVPLHHGTVREGLAQQLVAHGIAAIAWTALLYPLEYIHTRMAVGTIPIHAHHCNAFTSFPKSFANLMATSSREYSLCIASSLPIARFSWDELSGP